MPPTAEPGGGHPQAASFPWPAILVDGHGRMDGETRARGNRSARSVLIRKTPRQKAGLKGYEIPPARKNYPGQRIALCAHLVARRSCLPRCRQAPWKALLQRAARPNFFPSQGNTLSQTLLAFGAECQLHRNLEDCSQRASVVSPRRSKPTCQISPGWNFGMGATPMPFQSVPTLVTRYCAIQRHCLSKSS